MLVLAPRRIDATGKRGGNPEVMRLAANSREILVRIPLPIRVRAYLADPVFADLGGEDRAKSVPPVSHCLVAGVSAAAAPHSGATSVI
jgi:hypothetical protein